MSHIRHIVILLCFVVCLGEVLCPLNASAQQHNFEIYSVEQGLAQSQARSLHQDRSGFLWIGTYGGGLNRFDGHTFVKFSETDGLPDNTIWNITSDKSSNVWIATSDGLTRFDGKHFRVFTEEDGLTSRDVWSVFIDSKDRLWVGTSDAGLNIYENGKFRQVDAGNKMLEGGINSIFEDSKGRIWIGCQSTGLAMYEGGKFTYYNLDNGLTDMQVNNISESPRGVLYAATGTGVTTIKDGAAAPILKGEIATNEIFDVLFDRNGSAWFGTEDNGAFRRHNGEYTHFHENNGLGSNFIFCFEQDNAGNVWIGTDGGGICKYDGEMFVHFTTDDGLIGNTVMNLLQDSGGNIWFATPRGLTIYDGYEYTQFTAENGLSDRSLLDLFEDKNHNVWVGANSGVTRFTNMVPKVFNGSNGFTDLGVYDAIEMKSGELVFCTDDGMFVYNSEAESFSRSPIDSMMGDGIAYTIYEASDGTIWYGTSTGLVHQTGNNYEYYNEEDGMSDNEVTDTWEAPNGDLWFVTGRGITIWREDRFYTLTTRDGLNSNNVYSIVYYDGTVWLGHEQGLDRLYLEENFEVDRVKHYGRFDGFRGVECNTSAVLVDNEDYLWFGTIGGATRFDRNFEPTEYVAPVVQFNGLRLFFDDVDWTEHCENVDDYKIMPDGACLAYEDNHLTFDFIGIDLNSPDKVRYQFMLENFDEDWLPETDKDFVTYSNLPPGAYTFRVMAGSDENVWSESISYDFIIDAPFWRSDWFYWVTIPLLILVIYLVILTRTKRLERSKRRLEETVRLRTQEILAQKEEVEKLSLIASEMADGVVLCDHKGEIVWVNRGLTKLVGYTLEEVHEKFDGNIRNMSNYPRIDELLDGTHDEKFVEYDTDFPVKDGGRIWASATITPIFDENKKLQRVVVIYRDVTLRRGAEEKLKARDKERTDSIRYAKTIQEAILPSKALLYKTFPESFVFYRPRDIVSGDFYWFSKIGGVFVLVAADCTGHGVPGAFMSMIGNEFLHQIVNNGNVVGPDQALQKLDAKVKRALHQDGDERESKDGMDLAMCAIHLETKWCQFAGAFNPMYVIRDGEIIELDAAKESIGGYSAEEKMFYSHEMTLQKGDVVYLFSDGFIDQFGGPKGRKYMRKRFRQLLLDIAPLDMTAQQIRLSNEFDTWRGDEKQVDDVLVLGVKIT